MGRNFPIAKQLIKTAARFEPRLPSFSSPTISFKSIWLWSRNKVFLRRTFLTRLGTA